MLSGRLCTMLKAPAVQDAFARGIICMLPADHPIRPEGVASKSLLFSVLKDTCEQLVAVERASEKRRKLLGELLKLTGKFELLGHERFSVDVKLRFARKAGSPALNEKGISARVDARDLLDLMLDLAYSLARPPTLDQIKQQVAKASEREAKKWALRVLEPVLAPKLATLDIEWAEVERSLRGLSVKELEAIAKDPTNLIRRGADFLEELVLGREDLLRPWVVARLRPLLEPELKSLHVGWSDFQTVILKDPTLWQHVQTQELLVTLKTLTALVASDRTKLSAGAAAAPPRATVASA